jgi:cytochrome c-type biogenesis protein CcmH
MRRWLPWLALLFVLGGALAIAAGSASSGRATPAAADAARVARITAEIRCPTCRGLSAAESDAETAVAIKAEVANQVHQGRSDGDILAYMRDRYGTDILLRPPASGFAGLVWALPVIGFVVAAAGLAFAFRRWRTELGGFA